MLLLKPVILFIAAISLADCSLERKPRRIQKPHRNIFIPTEDNLKAREAIARLRPQVVPIPRMNYDQWKVQEKGYDFEPAMFIDRNDHVQRDKGCCTIL